MPKRLLPTLLMRHLRLAIGAVVLSLAATACGPLSNLFGDDECRMRPVGLLNFRVAALTCAEFVEVNGEGRYDVQRVNTSIGPGDLRPAGRITAASSFGFDGDVYELDGVDPDQVLVTEPSDQPGRYALLIKEPTPMNALPAGVCEYFTDPEAIERFCDD